MAGQGWSHVILDGAVVDTDRLRVKTTSTKGATIDARAVAQEQMARWAWGAAS